MWGSLWSKSGNNVIDSLCITSFVLLHVCWWLVREIAPHRHRIFEKRTEMHFPCSSFVHRQANEFIPEITFLQDMNYRSSVSAARMEIYKFVALWFTGRD